MTCKRMMAWCNDAGLISFGDKMPSDAHPISDGGENEMAIVKQLAHKDGESYWVPGIRDDRDWKDHIEAFADACCEHMDDGVSLYTEEEFEAMEAEIALSRKAGNSN